MPASFRSRRRVGLAGAATTLAAGLLLTACGGGNGTVASGDDDTVTITDARGEQEVPANPENIVVFDMPSLDTLDELGVDVSALPKSSIPPHLEQYAGDEYADVGTLKEPDYEAVNEADPDLVIVAGRSSEAYPEMAEHWPTIDLSVDNENFLDTASQHARTLGEIFGREDQVEQALTDLDTQIDEVNDLTADAGTGLIVLTSGGEVTAYGPGSRFGMIHDLLGVEPAIEGIEAASHGEAISFELIAETNPAWLFVVDRDAAIGEGTEAAEAVLDNELVAQTTAWQNDQVIYLDPIRWYILGSGLNTLPAMTDEIATGMS